MTARAGGIKYQRPKLYAKQREAMFDKRRISLIEASTKSGKTVSGILWLYEQALRGKPGHNYWWVAPVSMQARIAFNRMRQHFVDQDGRPTFTANMSDHTLTTPKGTVIAFRSGDHPDTLYGEDVYAAVIDEASRFKEESWHAIRSTLTATRGPIRIIGNVKGKKNWFYQLARLAEQGMPNFGYHKLTAQDAVDAGVLDKEEIDSARAMLPEHVFKELYYAEPSDDEGNPFGADRIRACYAPLSERSAVAWGWDLARKLDWTVGIGLDKDGYVCEALRFQRPWNEQVKIIKSCVKNTPALVDETGVGDPIIEAIKLPQQGYGGNVIELTCPRLEGYRFTSASKQMLMEGLSLAIAERRVRFPEGPISIELLNFEYEFTRLGIRYCMDEATPVLTDDLQWVPVGSLETGDDLLAFDEDVEPGRLQRCWKASQVTATERIKRPCYRVLLADGAEFICSAEHLWLTANSNGPMRWMKTSELRGQHKWSKSLRYMPHRLLRLTDTWIAEHSYDAGYLAAALDGEGSLMQVERNADNDHRGWSSRLSFAQRDNAMAAEVRRCLRRFGFEWNESPMRQTADCLQFWINGGMPDLLRLLGMIRPKRLLEKFDLARLGSLIPKDKVYVEAVEYLGEREVVALGTTTKTLVANGFASHNSAPSGLHDDCVCALALAWRCFDNKQVTYDTDLSWIGVD